MGVKPWTDAEVIRMAESLEDHCARQAATLRELLELRAEVARLRADKSDLKRLLREVLSQWEACESSRCPQDYHEGGMGQLFHAAAHAANRPG